MDDRTARLLRALDPEAVSALIELLAREATEGQVVSGLSATPQWTVNRRLSRLKDVGVVAQSDGKRHAPGRPWRISFPDETRTLLQALAELSQAIDDHERKRREAMLGKLKSTERKASRRAS